MPNIKHYFHQVIHRLENIFDRLKARVKKPPQLEDIELVIYHHYATSHQITVSGRALKKKNISQPNIKDSIWRNFINIYKRINSDEIPNLLVKIYYQNTVYETLTNEEGYFYKIIELKNSIHYPLKQTTFQVSIPQHSTKYNGKIYLPPSTAKFGIVSDVDDTIMVTNATNMFKLLITTFLSNVKTRVVFKGVANWYQKLQKGLDGQQDHPFFYVSSSPWNLYDLIDDFIRINRLPEGSILLRDYGIDDKKLLMSTHGQHKSNAILNILKVYPKLALILIGDSGQEDTFIYISIAQQFPERIKAIFIRCVNNNERVEKAIKNAQTKEIPIFLIKDSEEGLQLSLEKGLI